MPQWGNDTLAKSITLHSGARVSMVAAAPTRLLGGGAANTAIGLARLGRCFCARICASFYSIGVPTTFFGVAGMVTLVLCL